MQKIFLLFGPTEGLPFGPPGVADFSSMEGSSRKSKKGITDDSEGFFNVSGVRGDKIVLVFVVSCDDLRHPGYNAQGVVRVVNIRKIPAI